MVKPYMSSLNMESLLMSSNGYNMVSVNTLGERVVD